MLRLHGGIRQLLLVILRQSYALCMRTSWINHSRKFPISRSAPFPSSFKQVGQLSCLRTEMGTVCRDFGKNSHFMFLEKESSLKKHGDAFQKLYNKLCPMTRYMLSYFINLLWCLHAVTVGTFFPFSSVRRYLSSACEFSSWLVILHDNNGNDFLLHTKPLVEGILHNPPIRKFVFYNYFCL